MIHLNAPLDCKKTLDLHSGAIGFVPTMGALHEGHRSLIQYAKSITPYVVVSIFVNPTQFAPHEDFDQYPRSLDTDLNQCRDWGVDMVFTPSENDIYPNHDRHPNYKPHPAVSTILCGKSRPHFFGGVCNVVERLFSIVKPTHAFFGNKDLQQRVIIEQMVRDLNLNVTIVPCPIIRDENGLALSSRNQYLSKQDYQKALAIPQALNTLKLMIKEKQWNSFQARQFMAAQLEARGLRGDYVEIFRPTESSLVNGDIESGDYCCIAVYCGDVRLIDNLLLKD
ncbi:MAG: pantoate--beta-alanine ligase [Candidatus Margulisiibacteriota bacterium]